mmetsp:Transcript_11085/g.45203  ORF Transcript_11085/g.45203 Transcript_11085/m.45203 type:complete len:467 (-) Transcript_11085:52-1452(-)
MKFGNRLRNELRKDWEEHYVNYDTLKAILKKQRRDSSPLTASNGAQQQNEAFRAELSAELAKVVAFYKEEECRLQTEINESLRDVKGKRSDVVKAVLEELYARVNMLLEFCTLNDTAFAKILKKFVKMSANPQHAEQVRDEFTARLEEEAFNEAEITNRLAAQLVKQYSKNITNGDRQRAAKRLLNSWTNDIRSKPRSTREPLREKVAFIIDMDGVVYHGNKLLAGVPQFISWLQENQKKYLFLTNSSSRSPAELSQKLKRMGIDVTPDHFYTSALATAAFVSRQTPNGSAFVIGDPGLFMALYDAGYTMNDTNPDYVIIGETRDFSYDKIEQAVNLVRSGSRLLGTNCDLTDKLESRFAPACGSLIKVVESATGVQAYFMGKPNPLAIRSALGLLKCKPADACIVGDRMDTDMVCGLEADIDTVLVLSGVTQREDISKFAYRPKYIFNGVGDIFAEEHKPHLHSA